MGRTVSRSSDRPPMGDQGMLMWVETLHSIHTCHAKVSLIFTTILIPEENILINLYIMVNMEKHNFF